MSKLSAFTKTFAEFGKKRVPKNPRIYPKAKSKLFVVRKPTPIDPVEDNLLKQWWTDYRLKYNAVIELLTYELEAKEAAVAASIRRDDEGDRKRRWLLNESWNKETRIHSKSALETMLDELLKQKQTRIEQFERKMNENILEKMKKVEDLTAASEHLITWENLDQKLEEIINSPVIEYNFMVDQHGKITHGSEPVPRPAAKSDQGLPDLSSTDATSASA